MQGLFLASVALGFAPPACRVAHGVAAVRSPRFASVSMGFFDQMKKSFGNVDYSKSPATYEQTNARARHILVDSEEQAASIKAQIDDGSLDFSDAAVQVRATNPVLSYLMPFAAPPPLVTRKP